VANNSPVHCSPTTARSYSERVFRGARDRRGGFVWAPPRRLAAPAGRGITEPAAISYDFIYGATSWDPGNEADDGTVKLAHLVWRYDLTPARPLTTTVILT
jgi:hypothetical protein